MDQTLGHYKIVSELGRGGMGVVYKAYEESLNRYVAIKVLGEHLGHDESFVKRFVREARAAAALSHPNVIQIFFIGHQAVPASGLQGPIDRHYFVMEYVEGRSVHDLLEAEGALDPIRAARIVQQAASGLAAAHDRGLVHRDIKPANLLVTKEERVKIADFGLALAPADGATRLTATNSLMGTPGYLSPEQCCGEPAGPRSDIYSLGMTFYEMLTGAMPFKGESPLAVLRQILDEDPPPLLQVDPDLDPRIAKVVERMVAKEPNDRYPSCHELIADLDEILTVAGAAAGQPTASLPRAAVLPPLPPRPPIATSARTMARVSGRPQDAPTRVAPEPAQRPAAAAPPPPLPPAPAPAVAAAAPVMAAAVLGANNQPAEGVVDTAPGASAASDAPSGGRRWVVIGVMTVMLVVAVSAAGLFLGRPSSQDDGKVEAAAETAPPETAFAKALARVEEMRRAGAGEQTASAAPGGESESASPAQGSSETDASTRDDGRVELASNETAATDGTSSTRPPSSASAGVANSTLAAAAPALRQEARSDASSSRAAVATAPREEQAAAPARRAPVRETPRVAVIAVGEPMLAGAAEAAMESQLARHGIDLYDEGGILELRDSGGASSLAPSALLAIVGERGVDVLVLIDVEALRDRELRALGRYSLATTSRVRVDAFLAAAGDGIGRGWSEQVEYAEANAERQADSVVGRVSTEVAEAIAAGWQSYRAGAGRSASR